MSVACVIVSFHPRQSTLRALLDAIRPQVELCVVVDNGSGPGIASLVEPCAGPGLRLVCLPDNQGIAAALNQGIRLAMAGGADHVLLMDQDSLPAPDMVAGLLRLSRELQASGRLVAAVGPKLVDRANGRSMGFVRFGRFSNGRVACVEGQRSVEADFLVTSGSLIPVSTLNRVGLMDEGLFIDHVDTEWLLRARAQGYRAFGACGVSLQHDIGEFRWDVPVLGAISVPIHKEFRYFYVFRNSILLYKRGYVPWGWIMPDALRLMRIVGFMLLMHPRRLRVLRMMFRGVAAGVSGHGGRMR